MRTFTVNFLAIVVLLFFAGCQSSSAQTQPDESYQLYLTQIAASEAFLQFNLISTAQNYLELTNEKHRGLEWHFLKAALDQSRQTISNRNSHYYADVKISNDGKTVAAASSDSVIALFSFPLLNQTGQLKGHNSSVSTLGFNGNGKLLVSGGRDHAVALWNIETGQMVWKNDTSFSQGIYQVRFSPGDSLVGVVSWERIPNRPPGIFGFAKILDAGTGKELVRVELDNHPAAGIVFTPNGKNMILSTWGEIVYSYNISKGVFDWKYDLSDPMEYNAFHSIDISTAGDILALGSTDHRVHILNQESGEVLHKIEPWLGHKKTIKTVKFSSDGKWLSTAGEDQSIKIWNTTGWTMINSLSGHVKTVSALDWNPSSDALVSTSQDGALKVWNLNQSMERKFEICNFGPWQTPFTNDKRLFAAPSSDKKMVVYDAATGNEKINFGGQSGLCGDFSNDSRLLFTASFDGIVRIWDTETGREKQALKGHTQRVDGIAYSDKQQLILSVGDSTLRIWQLGTDREFRIVRLNKMPFRVNLTPADDLAIVGFYDGEVKIFDTKNWEEINSIFCKSGIQEMAVSDDGSMLAVYSGKNIEIRELREFSLTGILTGHEQSGYGLGFSPDGKYLISGSNDQTFKLWNLEKMICTLTFHGFEDTIYNCKILSENEIFLSSSQGKIWYYQFK